MADFEIHIERDGRTLPVGLARCNRVRGTETVLFEYAAGWLDDRERFSLEPALALTRGPSPLLRDRPLSAPSVTPRLTLGAAA